MVVFMFFILLFAGTGIAFSRDSEGTAATLASYNVPFMEELHHDIVQAKTQPSSGGGGGGDGGRPAPGRGRKGPQEMPEPPPPPPPSPISAAEAYERIKQLPVYHNIGLEDKPDDLQVLHQSLQHQSSALQ